MSSQEVSSPIINSPFIEPQKHWVFEFGKYARQEDGRRSAGYYRKDAATSEDGESLWIELTLANMMRARLAEWRASGWQGATAVTKDLLRHWSREDRDERLFFGQLEAAEAVIFLTEARSDFLQGVDVPWELTTPGNDGYRGFKRYAVKLATGGGKTTVMAMLAAWSILNKVSDRRSTRHSDAVLIVCPNLTIRSRLQELKPERGKDSLYLKRDLVPPGYRGLLLNGKVAVTNWHTFEPQTLGDGAAVVKRGKEVVGKERITFGKTASRGGRRVMSREDYELQKAIGILDVVHEQKDPKTGLLEYAEVRKIRYVERDGANARRIAKELGLTGRHNLLVFNDEAHHAYRLTDAPPRVPEDAEEAEQQEYEKREATVWVEGLDRLNRHLGKDKGSGLNFAVDFSATPFYLNSVGFAEDRHFPWIVSDFGLVDAVESGLVKVPQLALDDTSGAEEAQYFNLWKYVLKQLGHGEKGGKRTQPKPEAVLRHAAPALVMLVRSWWDEYQRWTEARDDGKRPVMIVVCKNTRLAKLCYDWLSGESELQEVAGLTEELREALANTSTRLNTVRVDTKVVNEDPDELAKDARQRWMRYTLDTVGKSKWSEDEQGQPIYPDGFVETAEKLEMPLTPPGRDVRCIVSVSMLTEGWDCQTVTHIAGLRPFGSQLLCEQVAGRGLRRTDYIEQDGMFTEEVARILGVPFEVVPFKATGGPPPSQQPRHRVYAMPEKQEYEIRFPRVEGYYQQIRQRLTVDWDAIQDLYIDPTQRPTATRIKPQFPGNLGKKAMYGPGAMDELTLARERAALRLQTVVYGLAVGLTRQLLFDEREGHIKRELLITPAMLLAQCIKLVEQYVARKVHALHAQSDKRDIFFDPYAYSVVETLLGSIRPDPAGGEAVELPRYERLRGPGSTAEVDFLTSKKVQPAEHTHLNLVVFDTDNWEQSEAFAIDTHPVTRSFVKNDRLGFSIPYTEHGIQREYIPDFILRLNTEQERYAILEVKGWLTTNAQAKADAARRWCAAVTAEGEYGQWQYLLATQQGQTAELLDQLK